jgi:hypothetical protein
METSPTHALTYAPGLPPAKAEPLQANDTFDVFFQWTICTLAATGAALLLMAALI